MAETPQTKFCPACGGGLRAGLKFCSHCGQDLALDAPILGAFPMEPEPVPVAAPAPIAQPEPPAPEPVLPALEETQRIPEPEPKPSTACPSCGKDLREGAKFCDGCGVNLAFIAPAQPEPPAYVAPPAPPQNLCPACGAEARPGVRFCPKCGALLNEAVAEQAFAPVSGTADDDDHSRAAARPALKKKNWLVPKLAMAMAAVVLVAGFIVFLVVQDEPSSATATPPPLNYSVGDIVYFGWHNWHVLDVQNGKALLLTEDVVEERAYNDEETDVTWETCTLRAYLNGEFYESFSEEDRARIALTRNENPDNTWGTWYGERFNTPGGNPTDDYIFLLSVPEILKYYPGQKLDKDSNGNEWCYEVDDRLVSHFDNIRHWWLLRSPGTEQDYAAFIGNDGFVILSGDFVNHEGGVRPALWVDLGDVPSSIAAANAEQEAAHDAIAYLENERYDNGYYAEDSGYYTGDWQHGMPADGGYGTLLLDDGRTYTGEFEGGQFHGQGTETWPDGGKYVGGYKNGLLDGQGTNTWPDGSKYVGGFKNGLFDGQGIHTWPDGNKYDGGYKNGAFDGQGTYTWPDGVKYVGEIKNGLFDGQGTKTWPDGTKYVGGFKNDQFNGQGTHTWPDGTKYVGGFKNDLFDGQGTYTWPDGSKYVGEFKNSMFEGYGKHIQPNGRVDLEGYWSNDEFLG